MQPTLQPRLARESLSRRDYLRLTLAGMCGVSLAHGLPAWAAAPEPAKADGGGPGSKTSATSTARSVIQIWQWGGASHLDTFDPKPEAGQAYCGPFSKPISTRVDGMRLCELLPLLGKQADKFSLIRSLTHGNNAHETAAYMVQTGRAAGGRQVYPGLGAVTSLFKGYGAGYKGLIPPYVVLTKPQGRFSESGFLGSKHKPFATGGDPAKTPFLVEGIVSEGMTDATQRARRQLLGDLNTWAGVATGSEAVREQQRAEAEAYQLLLGDGAKVFDLGRESAETRERYGRNTFGQSCLMARRLVESGVPYITINYDGWDTHKQHFQAMRRKLPEFDKGLACLLEDLAERGLLQTTIVWCCGEFGRTPKVQWEAPWDGGRGHYGKVFSALLAGGGFQGGRVLGASNKTGEEVAERPVTPQDLFASVCERLGIDLQAKLPHPQGLDVRVGPGGEDGSPAPRPLVELL